MAADLYNNVIALLAVIPKCTIPGSKTMSNNYSKTNMRLVWKIADG